MSAPLTTIAKAVSDVQALVHGGDGVVLLGSNTYVRKWVNINADLLADCVDYLRLYTSSKNASTKSSSVTDLSLQKTTLSGSWRGGRVSHKREDSGKYSIFQELHEGFVTTVNSSGDVDWSEFFVLKQGDSSLINRRPVLRLPNVAPGSVQAITDFILATETYTDIAYRDATLSGDWWRAAVIPQVQDDGSYVIDVSFSKSVAESTYIVIGRRESDFTSEETRLYKDIPDDQVTTLIESTVTATGHILVDSSARKVSEEGIFDVYVTLRDLKIPPGAKDVLSGGVGGIFKSEIHTIRGVLDADLETTVQGLLNMNLVTNVHTTGGRSLGYWDVMYTLLAVPATYIEYKAVKEFKEQASIYATSWDYGVGLDKYLSDAYDPAVNGRVFIWETLNKHYYSPTAHTVVPGKINRIVSVVRTVSYSESDATVPTSVDDPNDRPTVGEIVRLSNGIYKNVSEEITHPWWSDQGTSHS